MRSLITGAGQIGTQLAHDLLCQGHEVVILRRRDLPLPEVLTGATAIVGDVGDAQVLHRAMGGADAVFHCTHAPYDAAAWRRELPVRERAVMDAAASRAIPVVYPESVYAFGRAAADLAEGEPLHPCSPLGQVRAELLRQRAGHAAITISIVASDLFGPTAAAGSVATTTIFKPLTQGRRAYVLADVDLPHSWTYIPDLTGAMIHAATHSAALAPSGNAILHAPTDRPVTIRALAGMAAGLSGHEPAKVTSIPGSLLHRARVLHPMLRSLDEQSYLWRQPVILRPGSLAEAGMRPTPTPEALEHSLQPSPPHV